MKIQGKLSDVKADLDFYIRLTSTSSHKRVEDLRSYYYSKFLDEARLGLRSVIDSKPVVVGVAGGFEETVSATDEGLSVEGTQVTTREEEPWLVDEVGTSDDSTDGTYNAVVPEIECVKPVKGICLDDIASSTGYMGVILGTILDDVAVSKLGDDTIYEYSDTGTILDGLVTDYEYSENGTVLDDCVLPAESYERIDEYEVDEEEGIADLPEVCGTILDDYTSSPRERVVEDVRVYEKSAAVEAGVSFESDGFAEEDYLGDDTNELEGMFEDTSTTVEVPANNVIPIRKDVEPMVVLPPTVREYLKKHLGSTVSEVEQCYSKKVIEKEIKMGKIYKKGNRLYI